MSHLERQQLLEETKASLERPALRNLQELRGLGKEVWQTRDAQDCVNQERDAWQK